MTHKVPPGWLATDTPGAMFEDNHIGRKEIWEASDQEIDAILAEHGFPATVERGKPGSYIQTTVRRQLIAERRKNDNVIIPVGCVATDAAAWKAKRPLAAILRYLTLLIDDILDAFPPGVVPPVKVTPRTDAEMEPFSREPLSEGWWPVYALPRISQGLAR